jgi:hypothetical protein
MTKLYLVKQKETLPYTSFSIHHSFISILELFLTLPSIIMNTQDKIKGMVLFFDLHGRLVLVSRIWNITYVSFFWRLLFYHWFSYTQYTLNFLILNIEIVIEPSFESEVSSFSSEFLKYILKIMHFLLTHLGLLKSLFYFFHVEISGFRYHHLSVYLYVLAISVIIVDKWFGQ